MIPLKLVSELRAVLGKDKVLDQLEDLIVYSYDATAAAPKGRAEIVVIPETRDEVTEVIKIAARNGVPIYPRGSGTNLSGGTIPLKGGIVLSCLKMNKILDVDYENLTATVQPGVIVQTLNETIAPAGLMYPPDPGTVSTATMGGTVAECAGGLRGLKYGVTKHYVMGLEVALATGEVLRVGGKTVKNVTGYDLTKLFTGSEGTLGVITEITVKLIPAPEHKVSMMAVFDDLDKAARTISDIIKNKVIPATLEIMDNTTIRTVEEFTKAGLPVEAEAVLLIEVDGIREVADREAEIVANICRANDVQSITTAKDEKERFKLWEARRAALPALSRLKPTTILEDATVPRSKIPDMIRAIRHIAEKYDLVIGTFGHAGDGNLHPTIVTDARDQEQMKNVEKAIGEIFEAALSLGGTLSGEHGIGFAKAPFMEKEFGVDGLNVMRRIKEALDPDGLLNPGKMFIDRGDLPNAI